MSRGLNTRFFDQPGFDILFSTWSEVFEMDEAGKYALSPAQALKVLREARLAALSEGLQSADVTTLDAVAFRYAQETRFLINEAIQDV